jgi:ring-1,2-phenylacetyl-CoA epoxidase subunit PaaE
MNTDFHSLRVRSVIPDATDALIVTLDIPEDLKDTFHFQQGQHLTLRATLEQEELRRSYSICTGVDDGELTVGIRKVRGGRFSTWVHEHLQPGDAIDVMPPQGRFFAPLDPSARRHHVGIAAGSGITPILKTVLAREPQSRFTLIYSNRKVASTMFKEELEGLKNRYLSRLVIHYVFSGEHTDTDLYRGRVDQDKIAAFTRSVLPADQIDQAYICGPYQMNDAAEAALLAAGVPAEHVHVERFGLPPDDAQTAEAARRAEAELQARAPALATVTMVRDGLTRTFDVTAEHGSVLDAARDAGFDLPYSCKTGVCGTCRAKCKEGEVHMGRNHALDHNEVAQGFILTCQARPLSGHVVISFDER